MPFGIGRRKKRGTELERQLAHARLEDAMGRVEGAMPPDVTPLKESVRYQHVTTGQGRKAHLRLSASSPGVLCGWPGPWVPAGDPNLPVCRMCGDEKARLSGERAAS